MDIKNKTIIITGGANGIGQALSKSCMEKGANVYIIDIDKVSGEELEKETNNRISYIYGDISSERDIINAKDIIINKSGNIDILINNAATQTVSDFFNIEIDDFKRNIDVNLNGMFICSKIFGNEMKSGSKIINMLSVHNEVVRLDKFAYDASKAACTMLTKEMALALVDFGINVLGVSIGACNTKMNEGWIKDVEKVKHTISKIPLKWIAEPEQIASFIIDILEKFSEYTTGNIYTFDGGRSLTR